MSKLDDAIMSRMKYIVCVEGRPFSFKDFELFSVDGIWYQVAHGTFRNKISHWLRTNIVEKLFNSKISFYTLKGCLFNLTKSMTRNHMDISPVTNVIPVTAQIEAHNFLSYLMTLDSTANSVHDIHLKFTVLDIYKIMSMNVKYSKLINHISKDIPLGSEDIDDMHIHTTIHRTDTVTVVVRCTKHPVTMDERGITRLSCALTRVEERLSRKLDESRSLLGYESVAIPDNQRWQVTLWHFGIDRFTNEYPSKGYALTWGHGREVLRVYLKSQSTNKVERSERQESPNKNIAEALDEKRYKVE